MGVHRERGSWSVRRAVAGVARMIGGGRAAVWAVWLLMVLGVSPAAAGAMTERAAAHPQDGPHADLRLRIEPDGATFSIGLNLAFLDEAGAPPRELSTAVGPSEKTQLEAFIREFVRERIELEMDGVEVTPIIRSLEVWTEPDPSMVALYPRMGTRALIRAAVVAEYPADGLPDEVRATWPVYPRDELAFVMEGLTGPDGGPPRMFIPVQVQAEGVLTMDRFSEPEPTIEWRSAAAGGGIRFEDVPVPPTGTLAGTGGGAVGVSLALIVAGVGIVVIGIGGLLLAGGRHRAVFAGVLVLGIVGAAASLLVPGGGAVGASGAAAGSGPSGGSVDGDGTLTDEERRVVFETLHRNLYRAFDYTDESDVYDALTRSVSGGLLEDLYAQVYASLIDAEQGGMLGVITAVEPIETKVLDPGSAGANGSGGSAAGSVSGSQAGSAVGPVAEGSMRFGIEHTWRVAGTVYHWGHSHTRINEYRAVYTVAALEDGWRIVDQQMRSQRRIDPGPPPRATVPGEL